MNKTAKTLGEAAGLNAFGLSHGTPKPPPSWAQAWLKQPRKTGTHEVTIPSMQEKHANTMDIIRQVMSTPGVAEAALFGGLHTGANVAAKAVRRVAPHIGQRNFASGLSHVLEGKNLHPAVEKGMMRFLGPESLANYHVGQALGQQLAKAPPEVQQQRLKDIIEHGHLAGALKELPAGQAAIGGVERFMKGDRGWLAQHAPSVHKGQHIPLWQRAIEPAVSAATVAASPHTGIQLGWNTVRDWFSKTRAGKELMARSLRRGLLGNKPHPALEVASDVILSPALMDAQRAGYAVNKDYTAAQQQLNKTLAAGGAQPVHIPNAPTMVNFGEKAYQRHAATPAQVPAPTSASKIPPGALTKGLLLGGGMFALRNALNSDQA